MTSKRFLPQVPSSSTAISTNDHAQVSSRSAIEDLFQIFENNADFITRGKRLLNKKRKLEQLRAQLNLPEHLANEDKVKLLKLRERLKAKRRLRKSIYFITIVKEESNLSILICSKLSS